MKTRWVGEEGRGSGDLPMLRTGSWMRRIVTGVAVVAASALTGCMVGPTRSETEAGFGSTAPISMAALPEATVPNWNAQDRTRPSSATSPTSTSAGKKGGEFEPETGFFVGLSAVYTQ